MKPVCDFKSVFLKIDEQLNLSQGIFLYAAAEEREKTLREMTNIHSKKKTTHLR